MRHGISDRSTQSAAEHFSRARRAHAAGDVIEAAAQLQLSVDRDSMQIDVLTLLAGLRAADGDFAKAAKLYRKVLRITPRDVSLHIVLAAALQSASRKDEAVSVLVVLCSLTKFCFCSPIEVSAYQSFYELKPILCTSCSPS